MRNGTGIDMKKIISRSRICSLLLCLLLSMTAVAFGGCTATDIKPESTAEITSEQNRINTDESQQQADSESEMLSSNPSDPESREETGETADKADNTAITEDGTYTSADEVAEYIHLYGHLPSNYITKKEAESLGWESSKGNLWDVAPGKSIGGSRFGNYEGELPDAQGRKWYECDINYEGGYRNSERIVYSNDGLVYYTNDHYKTFKQYY